MIIKMLRRFIFLNCFLLVLVSSQYTYIPIPGIDNNAISYGGLIKTEVGTAPTFVIPSAGSWGLAEISARYYGDSSYWTLLRAANPKVMRAVSHSVWTSTSPMENTTPPAGLRVTLPSLLTCPDFLPLTCISRSAQLLRNSSQYLNLVNLDLETSQMCEYDQSILALSVDFTQYNALTTPLITMSWITNKLQTLDTVFTSLASPEVAFAVQTYHMLMEDPVMLNMTIINQGNLDPTNFRVCQPTGMGQSAVPGALVSQNGSTTLISVENDDFGGTTGVLFASTLQAAATVVPGLLVQWGVKNHEVFPNKISVDLLPSSGDLSVDYTNLQFDVDHLIDESITGNSAVMSFGGCQATVQISHSRICEIRITLQQTSNGTVYNNPNYYSIQTHPAPNVSSPQGLWFDPSTTSQLFVGTIQYTISNPPLRNQLWKLYEVKPNIYNIFSLCAEVFLQADTALSLLSFSSSRDATTDLQWNILPVPNTPYVIIQSIALEDQCLTGNAEWWAYSTSGVHSLPIYLTECSFNDIDQQFKIVAASSQGSAFNCPYSSFPSDA